MKLEDISAEIRPRYQWEAVDLGWALARKHYGTILRAWILTIWPLWAVILFLGREHLFWAMVVIWWLKPLYDRVPLFVLSRALFGPVPKMREVLFATPGLGFGSLIHMLILGRLSTHRSLVQPILQLEGLRWGKYYERAKVISQRAASNAASMQFASLGILHATWIGLAILIYIMVPNPEGISTWQMVTRIFGEEYLYPYTLYGWIALYLLALTLTEPFYVGAGFAMYLNTRTQIEGWDVELSFRRMAARLQSLSATAAVVVGAVFLLGLSPSASAQDGAVGEPDPGTTIQEVMEHPDFEIFTETIRISKNERRDSDRRPQFSGFNEGAAFFQAIFWIIVVVAAAFLLLMIIRFLLTLRGGGGARGPAVPAPKARTVMGMNVEKESLPADVVAAARKLWADGRHQDAIGLLYRGAISWLIETARLPIEESDTEEECVSRARQLPQQNLVSYFVRLTRVWIATAYGDQPPNEDEASALFEQWPFRQNTLKEVTA